MPLSRAACSHPLYPALRPEKALSWSIPAEDLALLGLLPKTIYLVRLERGSNMEFYKSLQEEGYTLDHTIYSKNRTTHWNCQKVLELQP